MVSLQPSWKRRIRPKVIIPHTRKKGLLMGRRDTQRRDRRYEPYGGRRRRSRSRSPHLSYDEPASNEDIELFPSKVNGGARRDERDNSHSRSPQRRRRIEQSHRTFSSITRDLQYRDQPVRLSQRMDVEDDDLFPHKVGDRQQAAMDAPLPPSRSSKSATLGSRIPGSDDFSFRDVSQSQIELFPEKVGQSNIELYSKIGRQAGVELFPDKVKAGLDSRLSGKSLAERIREAEDPTSGDLFPNLARRTGERTRRRKAEDDF